MKNITYTSAGAGSGKTYNLTHKVVELLNNDEEFRPEQLILTTFTNKAAAELMNEVRKLLCESGKYDLAAQLDNALIGTVHSVGYQLVNKYWYHCGISPKMDILDNDALKGYIDSTLADCVDDEDIAFFNRLQYTLKPGKDNQYSSKPFDWEEDVKKIIDLAHNFRIDNFNQSQEESLNLIDHAYTFDFEVRNPSELREDACLALNELVQKCEKITNRNSIEKANRIKEGIPNLLNGVENNPERFSTYIDIYNFMTAKKTEVSGINYENERITNFKEELSRLRYAPEIVEMYKEYVRKVFGIAGKWQNHYNDYKKEHNILDYNDIERMFIQLLGNDEVLSEIRNEYRYLMVDEFQDSNSTQIEIFKTLAENVKHSYWVGDSKQAIYGFRGTDTSLIENTIQDIRHGENGCERQILAESRRSVPGLVDFSNAVFSQAFKNLQDVELGKVREEVTGIEPLLCYKLPGKNIGAKIGKVAALVSNIIKDDSYRQYSSNLNNFAILARREKEVNGIAQALRDLNIPVSVAATVRETKEFELLKAVLTLCKNNNNDLAKATIAYLTSHEHTLESIIDNKIAFDNAENPEKQSWLSDLTLINKIMDYSKHRRHMGVGAYITSVIRELGLENYSAFWKEGNEKVWKQICEDASAYESMCASAGKAATLKGFLNSDIQSKTTEMSNNSVQVMTYHKAKGLGWPVVILLSLDDDICKEKDIIDKEILGVRVEKNNESVNKLILFPKISTKDLHDIVKGNLREVIENVKNEKRDEEKRLLYVGVTRAKDQLILITHDGSLKRFAELGQSDNSMLLTQQTWEKEGIPHEKVRVIYPVIYPEKGYKTESTRYIAPSSANDIGNAEKVAEIGTRIKGIKADDDAQMANFGNCLHQIYCCLENNHSKELVESLLEQYGFEELRNQSETIISNWDYLINNLREQYGDSIRTHHELGFKLHKDGQFITGSIDFVWETSKGDVIIDFKTFPGIPENALDRQNTHYAGKYAGQFGHYRKALEAAGHNVISQLVFYPSIGMIVKVENNSLSIDS